MTLTNRGRLAFAGLGVTIGLLIPSHPFIHVPLEPLHDGVSQTNSDVRYVGLK
jgi:hypothetical protein